MLSAEPEPSFDDLAAELRTLTAGRRHTRPSNCSAKGAINAERFVIDASVAVKWVVPEAETEAARLLRRKRLFAPDLLIPECTSIL